MFTLRNFLLVVFIIAAATTVRAQWLTKADECRSSREQHHHAKLHDSKKDDGDHDAGISGSMKWYWGQRNFGLGYIPKDALHNAYVQTNALRAAGGKGATPQTAPPAWMLDGPTDAGGRIESIAINPLNPNTVYAGSANGGVWKTMDGGNTWLPITDDQESIAMGSLAIDPEDTNIVFAGTGEFPAASDSYPGYGLLRSSDGGKTWMNVGPANVASYSKVIVNPKHSNLVYASAGRSGGGILRSSDGGLTWNWLVDPGLPQNTSVSDLALSMKNDTAVLYAGVVGKGVYQSTNGGDTWDSLPGLPFSEMTRIAVDVDPKDWQNVVVLSVDNSGNVAGGDDLEGIQYSEDGGADWTEADGQLKANFSDGPFYEGAGTPPQGWYDVYIRVDPSDFSHWLLGGVPFWSTHDNGQEWTRDASFHVDQHDAEFALSDPTQVYIGSDGGVFYSPEGADQVNSSPMNIPNSEFYTISTDQTNPDLTYGGLQDNGLVSGSAPDTWASFGGGDGAFTVVDPNDPSRIYFTITEQLPEKMENGVPSQITSGIKSGAGANDYVSWLNPLCLDSKNNILYFGLDHLYYTVNTGASWVRCKTALYESGDTGTSVQAIDAFGDKETVLCGTSGGRVYVTSNNGTSFTNVSAGLPGRWITSVKFNPSTKTTFYVTCSGFGAGHVFKTTNNGANWVNISSTLPDIPVNSIKMDPTNPIVLYIGTDVGVFFSPNDGGQWLPYGTGLPNVAVDFMDIQIAKHLLRVGTHGRSVWEVPMDDDETGIVLPAQRTVWTLGDSASIQWRGFGESVTLDLSLDAGSTWQNIATNVSGVSYHINSVSYQTSENALVRVSDGNNTLISPLFDINQQKAGDELATISELSLYLYDLAYDPDDNVLWGTNFNATDDHIYKIDPDLGTVLDSVKISPITQASNRTGFTGIKYDPATKHLFIQQVNTLSATEWDSYIYEVTTTGTVVKTALSPAEYGTGILVRDGSPDTLLVTDRMGPGSGATDYDMISEAFTSDWNFADLDPLNFQSSRNAIYGPRGLTYDSKLGQYLLAYTDFQGSLTTSALNGSYILFLDAGSGEEENALSIVEGGSEATNIRGLEYDPRGAGNTAWATILSGASSAKIVKIALTDGPSAAPSAVFSLTPGTIAFGFLDTGKTLTLNYYIHNTGPVSGTIQSIAIQPASDEFTLGDVSLPATILPGDSLEVAVTFSPHLTGPQGATLVVTPSGTDAQPMSFSITGNGTVNGAGVSDGSSYGWSLALSPNPARDYFEVDLGVERPTIANIKVFDVTGREVLSESLGAISNGDNETDISTAALSSGIYFVRVTGSNGEIAVARLAIEK